MAQRPPLVFADRNTQQIIHISILKSIMKTQSVSRNPLPMYPGRTLFSANALPSAINARKAVSRVHQLGTPSAARQQRPTTLLKQTMRYPLATKANKPAVEWQPFLSCLIDTVAVLIELSHKSLNRIARDNPNVNLKGTFELGVHSKFSSKIKARVMSRENREKLYIEASIPKFMTGQNIVGLEELYGPCVSLINAVLDQMGIEPSEIERAKINKGKFQIVRVDYAVHCSCGNPERAAAVMAALRSLIFAKAKDSSAYGNETIYAGQHSSRWTLRAYRKDLEIKKATRRLPANVYGRKTLLENVENCVRLELVLRSPELKRLGLSSPLSWSTAEARKRMQVWIDRLSNLNGVVPNVEDLDKLTNVTQLKLRAWLTGDLSAFTRAPSTFSATRKEILLTTGIDVRGEPSVELQRRALLCIRDVFKHGIAFKSYPDKWDALCAGVQGTNAPILSKSNAKKKRDQSR